MFNIFKKIKKYQTYLDTKNALSKLTERELKDIGLDRTSITRIALETAYGKDFDCKVKMQNRNLKGWV